MRLSPLLEWSSTSLQLITWLGGLSALLGAACGLLENDLKRVIAFSTTSQLGYMIVACGLSQYTLSLLHLINHAFFKALLFLSAGSVIHALADQQDMRKMGSLVLFIPFTYSMILLGSLSLMAFPFLTGFYSKDLILELSFIPKNFTRTIGYILSLIAAFLSALYSVRLLILSFLTKPNFPYPIIKYISEPSFSMFFPLILLGLGAAYFGYLFQETFLGIGSTIYLNGIFTHPDNIAILDGTLSSSSIFKFIPLLTLIIIFFIIPDFVDRNKVYHYMNPIYKGQISGKGAAGIGTETRTETRTGTGTGAGVNSLVADKIPFNLTNYTSFLNHSNIFNHWIIKNNLIFGNIVLRYLDRGSIEFIGPFGLVKLFNYFALIIEDKAKGTLKLYAYYIIYFVLLIQIFYWVFGLTNLTCDAEKD